MTDLSSIPQVDALLRDPGTAPLLATHGRRVVTAAIRRTLDDVRRGGRDGAPVPTTEEILVAVADELDGRRSDRLRRVVNATGVVLHTNLGRAPLSPQAREAMVDAAGYCTLEYELAEGARGSRTAHLGRLAAEACGAEAATVTNNGAAALVLVLAALSSGREAVVSRGELIEIGGSFRLPEIMAASGAVLTEVGTTNRTRLADYRQVIGPSTGLILKAHRSNYQVLGFATEPTAGEIADLARETGIPFVYDIGSGLLRRVEVPGLEDEPSAHDALAAGADLVVFSGDKLLGGPQAGIVAGRADLVRRCARHPLARALRVDKFRRGALEATLEAHLRNDRPVDLPVWAMLTVAPEELRERAEGLAERFGDTVGAHRLVSVTGGGSMPGTELDSWGLRVADEKPDLLAEALRLAEPPVIGRVEDGAVLLDLRTVPPAQDDLLGEVLRTVLDGAR